MNINGREVNTSTLEVEGVDPSDWPDFCMAYFSYAEFADGEPLTDIELDLLSDNYGD